jgi:RNA polymerase sigma-70 factor (ECF subfamily)
MTRQTLTNEKDEPRPPAGGDRSLVEAARLGDRSAFAALHKRYAPMVHGIALARVHLAEADDLVQEAFLLALEKIATLRDADAVGPWLGAIARNLAVGYHRRRRPTETMTTEPATQQSDPRDGSVTSQATAALAAIRTLPEAYHETLILRLVEGLTGPQIAACTGLTQGSVRVNLHRGFKLLRASLGLASEESP